MKTFSELSSRYATALFEITEEMNSTEKVLNDLRSLAKAFDKNPEITPFLTAQGISKETKSKAFREAMQINSVASELKSFLYLLADKGRLGLFGEIVEAFQSLTDGIHGVTRGTVRSAKALDEDEQQRIEEIVSKKTGKKVILSYEVDPSILGGLIAEVGGYRFDDTLKSHLARLKDELKRSAH